MEVLKKLSKRIVLLIIVILLTAGSSAMAASPRVAFGGTIDIGSDERVLGDVVIFGGEVFVRGIVDGDVVAVGSRAQVEGSITGDLVIVGGRGRLEPGSQIKGDVTIVQGQFNRSPEASVLGSINQVSAAHIRHVRIPFTVFPRHTDLYFNVFSFFFILFVMLLISYFFPGSVKGIASTLKDEWGVSLLIGAAAALLFIPLMLLLAITIVGIPLAILLPVFYWITLLFGQAGIFLILGQWVRKVIRLPGEKVISTTILGVLMFYLARIIIRVIPLIGGPIIAMLLILIYLSALGGVLRSRFGTCKPWLNRQ